LVRQGAFSFPLTQNKQMGINKADTIAQATALFAMATELSKVAEGMMQEASKRAPEEGELKFTIKGSGLVGALEKAKERTPITQAENFVGYGKGQLKD
jgi:hypothetical protein